MRTFKNYLEEGKQVGTIYHYTTVEHLHRMLDQENPMTLYSLNRETISATRNSNLPIHNGGFLKAFANHHVKIEMDGDKVSQRYKVKPVAGFKDNESGVGKVSDNDHRVPRHHGESEEAIFHNDKVGFNSLPYIRHIHISYHRDHDNKFINDVEPLLKKYSIPYTYGRGSAKNITEVAMREYGLGDPTQFFEICYR